MTFNYKPDSMASHYLLLITSLWKCGKSFSAPVEKILENKNHFSTLFPRGSESMNGLPQIPQAQLQCFKTIQIKTITTFI